MPHSNHPCHFTLTHITNSPSPKTNHRLNQLKNKSPTHPAQHNTNSPGSKLSSFQLNTKSPPNTAQMAPTRSSKSQPSNLRSRTTRTTRNITQNTKDRQAVNPQAPKKRSNRRRVEEEEQEHSSPPNKQVEITLENFHSQLENWSIHQLRQTLQKKKESNSNRLPPNIQDTISLLQQNYTKSKLMLALIGNVSEATVNKFL
jgi:hypothetical protein